MSPEYSSTLNLPKKLAKEVKDKMSEIGLDYKQAAQSGYAFCKPNGHITKISEIHGLPQGILDDGKKTKSPWHIVWGIAGEYKGINIPVGHEDEKIRGYGKYYRGNHRGHTKGPEMKALDRRPHKL